MDKELRILKNIKYCEDLLSNDLANKPSKVKRKLYELKKEYKRINSIRKVVK